MSTFKFKNNNYKVFPPQEGSLPVINSSSITTTWQQDISNIPASIVPLGGSINWFAVGISASALTVGLALPIEWRNILLRDYNGAPYLDWDENGIISSLDAINWLKVGARMPSYYDTDKVRSLIKLLEENYDELKDVVFTSGGTDYSLFMSAPGTADDTDLNKFYIVVDESDVIDRLKLVKYEKGEDANTSYWFDAGNGSGTGAGALVSAIGPYSKASGTGELTAFERTFDASDSSILDVGNNRITISAHGLADDDVVHYDRGILHTFDGSSSSIIDTSANTITIPSHGLVTNEIVQYSFKLPGAAIGGLRFENNYYVEKVDNNKIKLKDSSSGSALSLTSTGLGIRHEISGVFPGGITGYSTAIANPKKTFKVSVVDANTIGLKVNGGPNDGNAIAFSSVGKGTEHKLFVDPAVHYEVSDKVLVYESKTFHGVNDVGSNIIDLGSAHGYSTGDTTQYSKGVDANNSLGGIEVGGTYYVIKVNANTLKLAATYADAIAGTAITLTDGTGDNHELYLKWGAEVSSFGYSFGSKSSIFSNNASEVIFTNRTLKKSNWNIVQGKDVLVAKIYKSVVQAKAAATTSSSTTLTVDIDSGGSIVLGSTLSGTGVVGTPTVTAIQEGGITLSLTLSTAQSIANDASLTFTGFMNESLVTMDEADAFYQEGVEVFKSVAGGVEAPGTVEFTKGAQNWKMDVDTSSNDLRFSYNDADIFALNTASKATFYGAGAGTGESGQFVLNCEENSHGITIKGPPHSAGASYTLTLPNTDGSANQVLKTDGNGALDWVNQTSGVRPVKVDTDGDGSVDNTLGAGEDLVLKAGSNVTLAESGGVVTINSSGGGGGSVRTVKVDTNGDGSVNETLGSGEDLVLKAGTNVTLAESGGVVTFNSSGAGVTVVDEDDMSSNSATSVPSQQSVKAYVDNNAVRKSYFFQDIQYALTTGYQDVGGSIKSPARTGIPMLRELAFTVEYDYGGIPASTVNDISLYVEANFGVGSYTSTTFTATHVGNFVSGFHMISFDGDITGYFGDGGCMAASNTGNSYAQKFPRKIYYTPSTDKTYVEYSTQYGALMSSGTLTVYISPDRFVSSSSTYTIIKEFKLDRAQSTTTTTNVVQSFRTVLGVDDGEVTYRIRAREISSGDSGTIQEVHGTIIDTVWES